LEQMGKYQLVRRLATGGMAEVFLAKAAGPMGFEKELVVKRILPHLAEDPRFVEMFLTEAKLAARLNHGNVVQIFDFGEQEDAYFIAMEYVEGLNLKTLSQRAFQRGTPIPYPLVARIVSLACEGVAYAHELLDSQSGNPLGVIHRDISTDNILVSMTGGVKVVDFGIAKAANVGQQTQGGVIKGKLSYLPPEYLQGSPIELRADIYALGVVLYELIAGRKPFVAENEAQLVQVIIRGQPTDIRTLRADVPAALVQVIERALQKNREARYASCRQMQADLERFLFQCGEPMGALQIAELAKAMAAVAPGASSGRSLSREALPAVPDSRAPSLQQTTKPLRPVPSSEASTSPQEDTLVTPTPFPDTTQEDEELARLVARRRWHWPVALIGSLLLVAGGAVHHASRDTAPLASENSPSPAQPQAALPDERASAPTPAASPPSLVEPVPQAPPVATAQPQEVARSDAPKVLNAEAPKDAPPAETQAQPTVPSVQAAVPPSRAKLTVTSDLPAKIWINNGPACKKNPCEQNVAPGSTRIEVRGKIRQRQFNKVLTIQLAAGEDHVEPISFRLGRVQVQGQPSGMKVLSLDEESLDTDDWVKTYEGTHTLVLVSSSTGKTYPAECEVKAGAKVCMVVQAPK
jgi:serine/threonine protein kinase